MWLVAGVGTPGPVEARGGPTWPADESDKGARESWSEPLRTKVVGQVKKGQERLSRSKGRLVKWKSLSHVWLLATPWSIQPMGFSRLEYWSRLPFPSPGDLLNPAIKLRSPTFQADSLPAEPQGKPKTTGVGSLSVLQWIFLTQKSNQVSYIAGGFSTNWAMRREFRW